MKPFNLERAKAGDPVITREGRPARIICFDVISPYHKLIVLVTRGDVEYVAYLDAEGVHSKGYNSALDLFMKPKTVRLYFNVYVPPATVVRDPYVTGKLCATIKECEDEHMALIRHGYKIMHRARHVDIEEYPST